MNEQKSDLRKRTKTKENKSPKEKKPLTEVTPTKSEEISKETKEEEEEEHESTKKEWYPSSSTVFRLILLARLLSALYNLIWDCDETYNYWEPLHFLLYKHGFQTWEYASQYALRSYLYIFLHEVILLPFKYLGLYKITLFYTLRGAFAILSAYAETQFYSAVIKRFNSTIGVYLGIILITNAGMFLSVTAFLPSSFVIYFICLAYSSWLNGNFKLAIFYIAFSSFIGWPFVALLGISICIDAVFVEKKITKFIKYSIISAILIGSIQIAFDSYMFGKFVFAPLNIIKYNVFPSSSQGPNLYGEEPLSYYIINCFLNFNILFLFAMINIFLQLFLYKFRYLEFNKYHFLASLSMYLWLLVFFTRPHKEERFLYPIYPLICLTAAHSIYYFTNLCSFTFKKLQVLFNLSPIFILLTHMLISILRLTALFKNYSAQMYIFHELDKPQVKYMKSLENIEAINVCIAKEWYRFPSSFFLPESYKRQKWRLKFIKSNFGGQLPNEYLENTESILNATRLVDFKKFNDENLEIKERYFDLKYCQFYIDTISSDDIRKKSKFLDKTKWSLVHKLKFIDINKSKSMYRAIYIPYLYEDNVNFIEFMLFKKV